MQEVKFPFGVGDVVRIKLDPKDTDPIVGRICLCRVAEQGVRDYYVRWTRGESIAGEYIEERFLEVVS